MSFIPDGIVTPEIMIDVDVLDRNINRMAAAVHDRELNLRPHVKTHKIIEIAEKQLAAGAKGITVATIGEAEIFVEGGVTDVFIAYPLWVTPHHGARIKALAEKANVRLGLDSAESAFAMGKHLGRAESGISILIEVDSGHHRSGVRPEMAVEVARAAADAGLSVVGIFTFPGHSYSPGNPANALNDESRALEQSAAVLINAGFKLKELSGGSTPTALLDGETVATETRPGVYVFGDAQQFELERFSSKDIALTVAATVVSRHDSRTDRRVIVDAGSKILGSDRPGWATGFGRLPDHLTARITALSEHHATIVWPQDAVLPPLGSQLRVIPNHVCLAMNLVDTVTVIRQGAISGKWTVAARGANN